MLSSNIWVILFQSLLVIFISGSIIALVSRKTGSARRLYQRSIIGLALLLVVNLGVWLLSILVQFEIIEVPSFPFIIRGAALLSLIIFVWLWSFPQQHKTADMISLVFGGLVFIFILLGIWWLPSIGIGLDVNRLLIDLVGGIFAVIMLTVGIFTLLVRKPALWGFGLFSFSILITGYALHMVGLLNNYDYPIAVFIAQLAVYPLLLLLPLRLPPPVGGKQSEMSEKEKEDLLRHIEQQQAILDRRPSFTDPKILQSIIDIMDEGDQEVICQKIVLTISRIMRADLCALLLPPDENGEIVVGCGYDSKNENMIENFAVAAEDLPEINTAINNGEVRNFLVPADFPELEVIAGSLSLETTGPVLFVSVLSSSEVPISGLILLSPYSGREWTEGDEYYFNILAKLLVHFLQHSREMANLNSQLAESHRMELVALDLYEEARVEHQLFLDQVSAFEEREVEERSRFDSLVASQQDHPDAQGEHMRLRDEEESADITRRWVPEFEDGEIERLKSELHLALEEISHLKAELDEGSSGS